MSVRSNTRAGWDCGAGNEGEGRWGQCQGAMAGVFF